MLSESPSISADRDAVGIRLDLDRVPDGAGRDCVFVVMEAHRAGARDKRVKSVKPAGIGDDLGCSAPVPSPSFGRTCRFYSNGVSLDVNDKDIPSSVAGDEEAMVALLLRAGCQFPCLRLCLEIEAFT